MGDQRDAITMALMGINNPPGKGQLPQMPQRPQSLGAGIGAVGNALMSQMPPQQPGPPTSLAPPPMPPPQAQPMPPQGPPPGAAPQPPVPQMPGPQGLY
jgi:hypothetical protein